MENFRRNGGNGGWNGGNKFGGKKPWMGGGSDDRGFAKPQLHRATCATCGNSCEVPFKPNGSKPVYCRDCFKKDGSAEPRRFDRQEPRGFNAGMQEKRLYQVTCDKCGTDCEVPFRPTGERPVYCRPCLGKGDAPERPRGNAGGDNSEQFKVLNAKLDAILKALAPAAPAAKTAKEEVVAKKEDAPKAPAKKKAVVKKKK